VRPGTDAALALGMLHVIVNEELYDKEFVEKYTHGWELFVKRVNEYPPKKLKRSPGSPEKRSGSGKALRHDQTRRHSVGCGHRAADELCRQ